MCVCVSDHNHIVHTVCMIDLVGSKLRFARNFSKLPSTAANTAELHVYALLACMYTYAID